MIRAKLNCNGPYSAGNDNGDIDMQKLYDRADIYDLIESPERFEVNKKHWEIVFAGKHIDTLLDVSIGTGNVTLPLASLGVRLFGSDLSEAMLDRCGEKAAAAGVDMDLRQSDFREVAKAWPGKQFDCVASTGNSLAYVPNADVARALAQMDMLVKPNGYLYFDTRNWDYILRERPRFYLYNPMHKDGARINLMQVWDYNTDGSMTFNLLYTFEREERIFQKEQFEEHYFPVSRRFLMDTLSALGYQKIDILPYPAMMDARDPETMPWYCILAQK